MPTSGFPALSRAVIGQIFRSGKRLLVQGARVSTPPTGSSSSRKGPRPVGTSRTSSSPRPALVDEVLDHASLPVVAAGGVDASDVGRLLAKGVAEVQLATRFIACSDGDAHDRFKGDAPRQERRGRGRHHRLREGHEGARRNAFTDALGAGRRFPPRSKAWFFGMDGYRGRSSACIDCLADGVCKCKASGFRESFCITDALLRAAILGDEESGLFYTGQSVTRVPEQSVAELDSAAGLVATIEEAVARCSAPRPCAVRHRAGTNDIAGTGLHMRWE